MENKANTMTPVQEESEELFAQKIHRDIFSELNVEEAEVIIEKCENSTDSHRKVNIQDNGQGIEKEMIVETNGKLL